MGSILNKRRGETPAASLQIGNNFNFREMHDPKKLLLMINVAGFLRATFLASHSRELTISLLMKN